VHAGERAKRARYDGAGELGSTDNLDFYRRRGIQLEPTAAHTPQHNMQAESLNWSLVGRLSSLLMKAALGPELWGEAQQLGIYALNRRPKSDGTAIPFEQFKGRKPDVGDFRV